MEASATACSIPRELTDAERENIEREHHILERAEMIRDEAMPEVKKLNQLIEEAKCQAIRDVQMTEKEKRL